MLQPLLLPLLWAVEWAQGWEPKRAGQADSGVSAWSQALHQGFELELPKSVTVQEGLCVFVPCRVLHLPLKSYPVYGYWFREGANIYHSSPVATNDPHRDALETKERLHLLGDPQSNNCSLDIRDAQQRDSGSYFFRVENRKLLKHSFLDTQLSVRVVALTHMPDIHIPGPLESGHPRTVTCAVPWACERGTPPTFSWIWLALASPPASTTLHSSVLTLTPRPQDHGTNLTCRVTFPGAGVTVERTIQLNVSYALQGLTIRVPRGNGTGPKALGNGSSLRIQEGESLRLLCVADSNPPATLSWALGSLTLQPSRPSKPGLLELPAVRLEDQGEYVCRAQHRLGSQEAFVSLTVTAPLRLLGPACSWEAEGLRCTCSFWALPAPSVHWRLGEARLEGNSSNTSYTVTSSSEGPWANGSLSLHGRLISSLRLSCEAQNAQETHSATILLLPDKAGLKIGVVEGVLGGAGVTALLALCVCLIFIRVKTHRKQSVEKVGNREGAQPAAHPISQAMPTPGEDPELHYAVLNFGELKPWERPDPDTTEYSEIRICQ